MRTISAYESNALMASAGCQTFLRVRLRTSDGLDVDLSEYLGTDWVLDATWSASLDAPVGTATVTLRATNGVGISLSPMAVDSPANKPSPLLYDPLLREGRDIRIDVMTGPLSTDMRTPWHEVFFGRIDDVEVPDSGDTITLTCRDAAGRLQDTLIKEERIHGGGVGGMAVQTVMHEILGSVDLWDYGPYCPVDPLWQLGAYKQDPVPVMDALQDLAGQLGWDLRIRWREGHGFHLTLAAPERATNTPVWFFGSETYSGLSLVRRLTDIRNSVRVVYYDSNDRDSAGNGKRKVVTDSNSASVLVYGERWAEIVEASTSNINTQEEALRLAHAFIADLSESVLEVSVNVPLWWHLELGDFLQVQPDGVKMDRPENLAIESIEHSVSEKGAFTKMTLRGRPSTSRVQWLKKEAVPGIGKSAVFVGPNAPADLVVTNTVNGSTVAFKPSATGTAWDAFELHLSTTPGFTPSGATFRAAESTTRFNVEGLAPGVPYYAKLRGRDAKGNVGPASTEVELAPRYVEPRGLQPLVTYSSIPLNPDFEAHNDTAGPPDGWVSLQGTWGIDQSIETGDVRSGLRAVRISSGLLGSQLFAVVDGNEYLVEVSINAVFVSSPFPLITVVRVDFHSSPGAARFAWEETTGSAASGTWRTTSMRVQAPAGAKYARVTVGKYGANPSPVLYDSVRVVAFVQDEPERSLAIATPWVALPGTSPRYYKTQGRRVHLSGALTRTGGAPPPGAVMATLHSSYAPVEPRRFVVPTDAGFGAVEVMPSGDIVYRSGSTGAMWLDSIGFRVP